MKNNDDWVIGQRILKRRRALKYSQKTLADLADISTQFVSELENGKKSMSIPYLRDIATALDVSTDYIVYGVNNSRALSPIDEMLKDLSPYQFECAHEILRQYVAAVKSASPQEDAD